MAPTLQKKGRMLAQSQLGYDFRQQKVEIEMIFNQIIVLLITPK